MERSEIEWDELLWDIKARIRRTKAIVDGVYTPPKKVIPKKENNKPTAAEVISSIESQQPMTAERIRERSIKLREKVFGKGD